MSTEARSTEARSTEAQSPMASSPADFARGVLPPPLPYESTPRLTATTWLCDESATPLQDPSQPAVQVLFNAPTGDLLVLQRNARLVAYERKPEDVARRLGAVAGTFRWSGVLHEAALSQADSSSVSGASVPPHLHLIKAFDKRPSMSGFLSHADGILISQPWKPELTDSRLHANAELHRLLAGRGPWGDGMAHSAQDQNLVALCAPRKVLVHNLLLCGTLEWYSVGAERPTEGKEVENEAFGTALHAKLVAKEENWPTPAEAALFGVLLSADSFVFADGQFWRQRPCCQELFVGATSDFEIPHCVFSLPGDFLLVATSSTLRAYSVLPEAKYDKTGLVVGPALHASAHHGASTSPQVRQDRTGGCRGRVEEGSDQSAPQGVGGQSPPYASQQESHRQVRRHVDRGALPPAGLWQSSAAARAARLGPRHGRLRAPLPSIPSAHYRALGA